MENLFLVILEVISLVAMFIANIIWYKKRAGIGIIFAVWSGVSVSTAFTAAFISFLDGSLFVILLLAIFIDEIFIFGFAFKSFVVINDKNAMKYYKSCSIGYYVLNLITISLLILPNL